MIYTVSNTSGIGRRCRVFVNGSEVKRAIYADTDRGVVKYIPNPARPKKGADEVYTRMLKGAVTVEFMP